MANLAGLKVLVTRPEDQAASLAKLIERAGGIALRFPLLAIAPVQEKPALLAQVAQMDECRLAIFISPNAVHYGMAAFHELARELPGNLKIATVGPGSAKALRELGVTDVIVPAGRYDSEGLLAVPQLQHVSGWRVMIFRGEGGRELLGDTLKARGAQVVYVSCYRRGKPKLDVDVLRNMSPDAITVSSSEALGYLWQMSELRDSLRGTVLFVPHPRIAQLAREQGWLHIHLTDAGDAGMLAALEKWACDRQEEHE